MASRGVVRSWYDEDGWGVVDTGDTPGGCWAHYSAVLVAGFKTLTPGQQVEVEWQVVAQDGFAYRATRVWPAGEAPYTADRVPRSQSDSFSAATSSAAEDLAAYRSRLTITFPEVQAVRIHTMTAEHWPRVREIYAAGIATGHATFESEPPTWEHFDETRLPAHRLVAVSADGAVLGWVAATAASTRAVYSGVVQHSVFVDPAASGRGVGRLLLRGLVASTEAAGIWTIQSGIFPENTASLAVHAAVGFRVIGVRERLGTMTYGPLAGRWRDVIAVERRSPRTT